MESIRIRVHNKAIAKVRSIVFASLFVLIIQGCEYEPTGEYFRSLSEVDVEIPVLKLNLNDSIVYVEDDIMIEYELSLNENEILLIEFYFNSVLYTSSEESSGSFLLKVVGSVNQLEMRVYTSTNSGSIADDLGAEAYVFSAFWKVLFDKSSNTSFKISSIDNTKGNLFITWENASGAAFNSYEIYRLDDDGSSLAAIITDPDSVSFVDNYFIGGEVDYFIKLIRNNLPEIYSDTVSWSEQYVFSHSIESDNSALLAWEACDYIAGFEKYVLYEGTEETAGEIIYESSNRNDTTYSISLEDFSLNWYYIEYKSSDDTYNIGYGHSIFHLPSSIMLPDFNSITQPSLGPNRVFTDKFYYDPSARSIVMHDIPDGEGLFAASPQSRYILAGKTLWEVESNSYREVYKIPDLPERFLYNQDYRVSLSSIPANAYFSSNIEFIQYNLRGDYMERIMPGVESRDFVIAPNNDLYYAFSRDSAIVYFYTTQGGYNSVIENCTSEPIYYKSNEIFIQKDGATLVMAYTSGAWDIVETKPKIDGMLIAYDPVSETLLTRNNGYLKVYSAEDMSFLYERMIGDYYSLEPNSFAYMDGLVFLKGKSPGNSVMIEMEVD